MSAMGSACGIEAGGGAGGGGGGGAAPQELRELSPSEKDACAAKTKKLHSKIRWDKPFPEIEALLDPYTTNWADQQNGNTCIHLAAQNGHRHICEVLITRKDLRCDVNKQNGGGQTALHMTVAYDYFWISKMLCKVREVLV